MTTSMRGRLDPFLVFDALDSRASEATPQDTDARPYCGFEAITYVLEGAIRHSGTTGACSVVASGGVHCLRAGRGLVRREMPEPRDGRLRGFHLWLNLPGHEKKLPGGYEDVAASEIPDLQGPGFVVRVVAGICRGVRGPVQRESTAPLLLDVRLQPRARFDQLLPPDMNGFVYVYEGHVQVSGTDIPARRMGVLSNGHLSDGVSIVAGGEASKVLLVAGRPLNQPVAQAGHFVANSFEELLQAGLSYRTGHFDAPYIG